MFEIQTEPKHKKIYSEISECRLCHSRELNEVLDLKFQPPANSLRASLTETLPEAPLQVVQCGSCSAVQLTATVDPNYLFSQYVWVTATSATARAYSEEFANQVLKRTGIKNSFVVEVASNDGTFLKKFKEKGCEVLGVDPAQNIASVATQEGIPTWSEFFNSSIAQKILAEKSRPQIVMARNVIPHVKEIHSIIEGLSNLVDNNGSVVIEFHYAESIVKELHYDSIYHEHLFFYSLKSLSALLAQYKLFPFDAFRSPISGGSIVLFFSHQNKTMTKDLQDLLDAEERSGLNSLSTWKEFGEKSIRHAEKLKMLVSNRAQKNKVVAYGASARSSTMLNFAGLSNQEIDCVIDRNPLKQNLYTPGTHIKIVDYEEGLRRLKGRDLLLLAWNFEEEIVRDLRASGYQGDIIVPLPHDVRIRRLGE